MTREDRLRDAMLKWEAIPQYERLALRDLFRLEDDLTREPDPHRDLGVDLALLGVAKEGGWDWVLHTSWCSAQEVYVLRLRAPGAAPHAAKTKVGDLAGVLRWGAGVVEAGEGEKDDV